jgi:hypothetical protein
MAELTDVLYPIACWTAWREGDEYASVELVRALCSPNLIVRVITRAILKESGLKALLTSETLTSETRSAKWNSQ